MSKVVAMFIVAALCNGASWWSLVFAQHAAQSPFQLIQLGGTAGLIGSLLVAIVTLWRDRTKMLEDWSKEVAHLRELVANERSLHRREIAEIRESHKQDLTDITEKYMTELRNQISNLRDEASARIEAEREISDEKYGTAP